MILHSVLDEKSWVQQITDFLKQRTEPFNPCRVFLPAGETPRPLYRHWEEQKPTFLNSVRFIQLDEVLQASAPFKIFFQTQLPSYEKQFEWITTADRGAHIAVLGVGRNGHVAFHEPHIPREMYSGCIELAAETCKNLNVPGGSKGITYGLSAFLRCSTILLLVRGESKKDVLKKLLQKDPTLPATQLMLHPDFHIFTDLN